MANHLSGIGIGIYGVSLSQSGGFDWLRVNAQQGLFVAQQNSDKATYSVSTGAIAITASTDVFAIEAGAAKTVRLRRITLTNPGSQTTAGLRNIQLIRTTTAGVGSAVVPAPMDTTDAAYSGLARSGNTGANLGTAGTKLFDLPIWVPGALGSFNPVILLDWTHCIEKAPTIQPGVANGLALRDPGAAGGAGLALFIEFTEE